MEREEAKRLVVSAGKALVQQGLIARTWGNVSCRIDGATFAITPSGRDYMSLAPEEVVVVEVENLTYEGGIKPSSEKRIHGAIYRMSPAVNFIIHTHQEQASVVSVMNIKEFVPDEEFVPVLGERVLCAAYGLPGTKKLCRNVVKAVGSSAGKAVILKNHGAVCTGVDYEDAFAVSRCLETACTRFIERLGGESTPVQAAVEKPGAEAYEALLSVLPKESVYILNQDAEVIRYSRRGVELRPYIDDFAQIVGIKATVKKAYDGPGIEKALKKSAAVFIEGGGAICCGKTRSDAEAVSMLVSKNCKAYFGAYLIERPKTLPIQDAILMRQIYMKKYSKLAGGE